MQGVAFLVFSCLAGKRACGIAATSGWGNQPLVNAQPWFSASRLITNLERKALWCTMVSPARTGKVDAGWRLGLPTSAKGREIVFTEVTQWSLRMFVNPSSILKGA